MKVFQASLVAVLIGFSPHTAPAQTVVRVESNGSPIFGAEVAVWDSAGRVASARTNGAGTVRLVLERPLRGSALLLVRRLGFAPDQTMFEARDSMVVTLSAVAVPLPALASNVSPLQCGGRSWWQPWRRKSSDIPNDPLADSLWRTASARYSIGVARLRAEQAAARVTETVTAEQRGYGDGSEMPTPVNVTYYGMRDESGFATPPPYALYERHINVSGEFWRWRYASLGTIGAEHFVTERFHERHRFVVLGQSAGATVVGFCPRDASSAELEGELKFGPGATLLSARWFFRVSHDDEDAGGESTFTSVPFEGRSYLLAIRGSSWVRATSTLYTQRRFETTGWRLSPRAAPASR